MGAAAAAAAAAGSQGCFPPLRVVSHVTYSMPASASNVMSIFYCKKYLTK